MMDYNEYVISESGALSYRIAVPCFVGEGADFLVAARMNRFYCSALSEMFRYASAKANAGVRRRSYVCSFCVDDCDNRTIRVTLLVSERLVPMDGGRSQTLRKEISHVWREGVIIKKTVR
jgi:hypothetical protein